MYQTKTDLWDERMNFEMSLAYIDPAIPRVNFKIDSVEELAEHFVMWEYAVAMCGWLMKVCPFDQPDVASAKAAVLDILRAGQPACDFVQDFVGDVHMGEAEVRLSPCLAGCSDLHGALRTLFADVRPGDFFALNAFLPFTGEGRREALEAVRHGVAERLGVASCLEVGPRYLHSTGQLHKGGPNTGVFLILSADELKDVPLSGCEAESLGALAKAQANGRLADAGGTRSALPAPALARQFRRDAACARLGGERRAGRTGGAARGHGRRVAGNGFGAFGRLLRPRRAAGGRGAWAAAGRRSDARHRGRAGLRAGETTSPQKDVKP